MDKLKGVALLFLVWMMFVGAIASLYGVEVVEKGGSFWDGFGVAVAGTHILFGFMGFLLFLVWKAFALLDP